MNTETHYYDEFINIDIIEFPTGPIISLVSREGHCCALDATDNFFSAMEIVEKYTKIFPTGYDEEIPEKVVNLMKWLIKTGANPEELEDVE